MTTVMYHSRDLDGQCSGAIVKYKHPDCNTIGVDYGDDVPWDQLKEGETVFVVDFSFDVPDMKRLDKKYSLIWIDHHKTAIEKMRSHGLRFNGLQKEGLGACALTWTFCRFDTPMPWAVILLAEYDVWIHTKPETLSFQYGMRLEATEPESHLWKKLFSGNSEVVMDSIIEKGHIIRDYEIQSSIIYAAAAAFEIDFEGLKCIAINKVLKNSFLFESVFDEDKHDAMLAFGWTGATWSFSLYSTKVDVSPVAVRYGGGGHPNACGFKSKTIPFFSINTEAKL